MLRSSTALAILLALPALGNAQTTAWDVTQPRGRTREISFTTTEGTWMSVDVSPNGQWLVFDLLGHIYRVPAAGGDATALTQNSGIASTRTRASHPMAPSSRSSATAVDRTTSG